MRLVLLISFSLLQLFVYSQKPVNFEHKKISKSIQKILKVDNFTLEEIQGDSTWYLKGKFFTINQTEDSSNTVYIGRVNSCRAGGCSIYHDAEDGSYEYFDYLITFNKDKKVVGVKVFNYQATHGQEMTAKSWLKQFVGLEEESKFEVGKQIDAISGATISVYAITDDIKNVLFYLKQI